MTRREMDIIYIEQTHTCLNKDLVQPVALRETGRTRTASELKSSLGYSFVARLDTMPSRGLTDFGMIC